MSMITSNAVNDALVKHNYLFTHYVSGFSGVYTIEMPFTDVSNTTTCGSILINGRFGQSWLINFYCFYNSGTQEGGNYIAKVFQFKGLNPTYDEVLGTAIKWDIDTVNNKIKLYLKKSSGGNMRLTFKMLSGYRLGTNFENVNISASTSTTEYNNAQYSSNFYVIG